MPAWETSVKETLANAMQQKSPQHSSQYPPFTQAHQDRKVSGIVLSNPECSKSSSVYCLLVKDEFTTSVQELEGYCR